MEHPIPVSELPPTVAKICGPSAPPPVKLMAARGMLPIPQPTDLVTVLYMLAHDPAPTLAQPARETLLGLPEDVARGAFAGELDPRVLDYLADAFGTKETLLAVVLRNPRTADETFERVAGSAGESIAELIAINETRLLRRPKIIEALYFNKRARMSTVDRLIELAVRHGLTLDGIPAFREIAAAIEGQPVLEPEAGDEASPDDQLFSSALSLEDDGSWSLDGGAPPSGAFADFDSPDGPKPAGGREGEPSRGFDVSRLTVSQKIRLALLGNAGHRALLIRDPNRLVAMAAIKSPAVSDQEVAVVSQSRAVAEDVIRYIADNRDWTKSYIVKCNLVNNPKTPISHSLRFLPHLRPGDLRALAGNKNVPQAVSNAARQILQRRPGGH